MKFQHLACTTAVAFLAGTSFASAETSSSSAQPKDPCARLIQGINRHDLSNVDVTIEQARSFQQNDQTSHCQAALDRARQAGAAANESSQADQAQAENPQSANAAITVQQAAPSVTVDQPSPHVTVTRAQPQVTVQQPMPQIIVRQPQPTVTVDIPQPEIVIRMPKPNVQVSSEQPQVQVSQAKPQVQVIQPPTQPRVTVEAAQPTVQLQKAGGQPDVQIQQSDLQPDVRYQREKPRVVINQPKGQPKVTFEQVEPGDNSGDQAAGQSAGQAAEMTRRQAMDTQQANDGVSQTQPAGGSAASDVTASTTSGQDLPRKQIKASALHGFDVVNVSGKKFGEVDRLVRGPDGKILIVITPTDAAGTGDQRVTMPINQTLFHVDELMVRGLSDDELTAMPKFAADDQRFQDVDGNYQAAIRVAPGPQGQPRQPVAQ